MHSRSKSLFETRSHPWAPDGCPSSPASPFGTPEEAHSLFLPKIESPTPSKSSFQPFSPVDEARISSAFGGAPDSPTKRFLRTHTRAHSLDKPYDRPVSASSAYNLEPLNLGPSKSSGSFRGKKAIEPSSSLRNMLFGGALPSLMEHQFAPVFTSDGSAIGFPTVQCYNEICATYLSNLSDRKRGKALINEEVYVAVSDVLSRPGDTSQYTANFRFWARKMFKDSGDFLTHRGKPVATMEQIYSIIVHCHGQCKHAGRDVTVRTVNKYYSWIPKELVASFIKVCPTCDVKRRVIRSPRPGNARIAPESPEMPDDSLPSVWARPFTFHRPINPAVVFGDPDHLMNPKIGMSPPEISPTASQKYNPPFASFADDQARGDISHVGQMDHAAYSFFDAHNLSTPENSPYYDGIDILMGVDDVAGRHSDLQRELDNYLNSDTMDDKLPGTSIFGAEELNLGLTIDPALLQESLSDTELEVVYPSSPLEDGEVEDEAAADAYDKFALLPAVITTAPSFNSQSRGHTPLRNEDHAEQQTDFSSTPRLTRSRFRASRPPSLDLRHSNFNTPSNNTKDIRNNFTHHRYHSMPTSAGLLTPLSHYPFSSSGSSPGSGSGSGTGSLSSPSSASFYSPTEPPSPLFLSPRLEAMTLESSMTKASKGSVSEECAIGEVLCDDDVEVASEGPY